MSDLFTSLPLGVRYAVVAVTSVVITLTLSTALRPIGPSYGSRYQVQDSSSMSQVPLADKTSDSRTINNHSDQTVYEEATQPAAYSATKVLPSRKSSTVSVVPMPVPIASSTNIPSDSRTINTHSDQTVYEEVTQPAAYSATKASSTNIPPNLVENAATVVVAQPTSYTSTPSAVPAQTSIPVVVTAASENHGDLAFFLLDNLNLHNPAIRVVFYDMGLSPAQRAVIYTHPAVRDVFNFSWDLYPLFFNVNEARGEYAWKAAMIMETLRHHEVVLWLDSGDAVSNSLEPFVADIMKRGVVTTETSTTTAKLTHQGTWDYLSFVAPELRSSKARIGPKQMCNGAIIGISREHPMFEAVVMPFYRCVLNLLYE